MNIVSQVASSLRWSFSVRLGTQALQWGATIIVVRLLTPQDYGLMAMALALIGFLIAIADCGLSTALVQRLEWDIKTTQTAFGFLIFWAGALVALAIIGGPASATFFGEPAIVDMVRVLAISLLFAPFSAIGEAQLRRQMAYREISLVRAAALLTASGVTLVLAAIGWNVWALVIGHLAGNSLRGILFFIVSPFPHTPRLKVKTARPLIAYGVKLTATNVMWAASNVLDRVILGRILGASDLGLYSISKEFANLPLSKTGDILSSIGTSAFSRLQDNRADISYYYRKTLSITCFVFHPMLLGLAATAKVLVPIVFGEQWADAAVSLAIMSIAASIRFQLSNLHSLVSALGHPGLAVLSTAINLFIISLCLLVGAQFGINGAALAWLVTAPIVVIVNYRICLPVLPFSAWDVIGAIWRPFACAALMGVVVVATGHWIRPVLSSEATLAVMVVTGIVCYAAFAALWCRQPAIDLFRLLTRRSS